jgi:hypothetical protein
MSLTNRQHDEANEQAIADGERQYAEALNPDNGPGDASYEEYMAQQGNVCECEQDWTCPPCKAKGRFGGYTYLETRFDHPRYYDDPRGE